ncbi:MAG: hypothetical protein V1837_07245 [Candidatus Woesearchaeota archaeon]
MKGLIVAVGEKDSISRDRTSEIRGLSEYASMPVVKHILMSFDKIGVNETLLLVNPNHKRQYEQALSGYNGVRLEETRIPSSDVTFSYIDGFGRLGTGDHIIASPDDCLFTFSLEGLMSRFNGIADTGMGVMAVRNKVHIQDDNFAESNYGWCTVDKAGRFTEVKSSFHDKNKPWPENRAFVTLDLSIIHKDMICSLLKDIQKPNIQGEQLIRKYSTQFYAWVINEGAWFDIGKPSSRKKAEEYFSSLH